MFTNAMPVRTSLAEAELAEVDLMESLCERWTDRDTARKTDQC